MKKLNVTVKKPFLDRYTGKSHKPGDKLILTDVRVREIKRSGDFVEVNGEFKYSAPDAKTASKGKE